MYLNSVNNSSKLPVFKRKMADVHDSSNLDSQHARQLEEMKEFASLEDRDLRFIATFEPNQKMRKTRTQILNTLLFALPAADVLITSAAKNANLSGKLSAGARQAGRWVAVLGIGTVVLGGVKKFVNKNVAALNEADKKHPALGFAVDFAAMLGSLAGLYKLKNSASKYIAKNCPKQVKFLKDSVKTPLKIALNGSAFNKKLVEPLNSRAFASVNGWGRSLKITEALLTPVILTAAMFKGISVSKQSRKEAHENYAVLKSSQIAARAAIAKQEV